MLVERRFCLGAAVALLSAPSLRKASAAPPPFTLSLPSNFVKLSSPQDKRTLLVAGDFSKLIGSEGAATTISVQLLESRLPAGVSEAAEALARQRDSVAGICPSRILPSTLMQDGDGGLSFEFLTPLVCSGVDVDRPDLTRHTIARALPIDDGATLVLWAGARAAEWDDGVGTELKKCARTLALRRE